MTIFVRNFHTPYSAGNRGAESVLWFYAELLRLAGYEYDSDDGDPAWASSANVLIDDAGAPGFTVDPNEPLIVTDPSARFTQAMVDGETSLILRAANDYNKGAWRMVEFLTSSKVRIDSEGRPPYNWTPETGIPGRAVIQDGLLPLDGAWIMFNAPSPCRLQVRLLKVSYTTCHLYIRPEGQPLVGVGDDIDATGSPTMDLTDSAGVFRARHVGRNITISNALNPLNNGTFPITAYISDTQIQYTNASGVNETSAFDWEIDGDASETTAQLIGRYYSDRVRMNMVASGANLFLYNYSDDGYRDRTLIGELVSAETEDETPGLWWGTPSPATGFTYSWDYKAQMLDHQVVPATLEGWPTFLKSGWNIQDQVQWNAQDRRRLVNGYAFGRSPWLVMDDVAQGGYVRGRLPLILFSNINFIPRTPLDGAGLWLHLEEGLVVPRNGPNDPLIVFADTGV